MCLQEKPGATGESHTDLREYYVSCIQFSQCCVSNRCFLKNVPIIFLSGCRVTPTTSTRCLRFHRGRSRATCRRWTCTARSRTSAGTSRCLSAPGCPLCPSTELSATDTRLSPDTKQAYCCWFWMLLSRRCFCCSQLWDKLAYLSSNLIQCFPPTDNFCVKILHSGHHFSAINLVKREIRSTPVGQPRILVLMSHCRHFFRNDFHDSSSSWCSVFLRLRFLA